MDNNNTIFLKNFLGKTLIHIDKTNEDVLFFVFSDYSVFEMKHRQDCCENVYLQDVVGDFNDLLNSPLLLAQESSNDSDPYVGDYEPESYTWTYYKFATINGYVDLKWFGSSNGYYSETANIYKVEELSIISKYKSFIEYQEFSKDIITKGNKAKYLKL